MKEFFEEDLIFNTLNVLAHTINRREKADAKSVLKRFSIYLRAWVAIVEERAVSLSKVINLIQETLVLEGIRFGKRINFNLNISAEIDSESIYINPKPLRRALSEMMKNHRKRIEKESGVQVNISQKGKKIEIRVYSPADSGPRPVSDQLSMSGSQKGDNEKLINLEGRELLRIDLPEISTQNR